LDDKTRIESVVDADYMQSVDARLNSFDAYIDYQTQEAKRAIPFLSQFFQIENARVLEVGAGRGGKGIAYARQGMRVTALDVDLESLALGARAAQTLGANVRFMAGDGEQLAFPNDLFDAVLLDSVIEHVHQPAAVLRECYRVLKPGGILFVIFPPFYGPLSGHIDDFVMIPWFHLLPRPVVKKFLLSLKRQQGILTPAIAYEVFATLNRLTIFQFRRKARRAGFQFAYFQVRPFLTHPGNRFAIGLVSALRHPPRLQNLRQVFARARHEFDFGTVVLFILLSAITPLVCVPILQEVAAGACKAVLRKT